MIWTKAFIICIGASLLLSGCSAGSPPNEAAPNQPVPGKTVKPPDIASPPQEKPQESGDSSPPTSSEQGGQLPVNPMDDRAVPVSVPASLLYEALVLKRDGVQVHAKPDPKASVIGELAFGDHLFVIRETSAWIEVVSSDRNGWVMKQEITTIAYDSTRKKEITEPERILVLVNKEYRLPSTYVPDKLRIPQVPFPFGGAHEKKHLREEAAQALEEMFTQAKADGMKLYAVSGYRSYQTQKRIFPTFALQVGFREANTFSAFPGESEHQTGLAMDVTSPDVDFRLVEEFGATPEGQWVAKNAHRFGFIVRYPSGKENITGYSYEPWHLRYVAREAAATIYHQKITLEEYMKER